MLFISNMKPICSRQQFYVTGQTNKFEPDDVDQKTPKNGWLTEGWILLFWKEKLNDPQTSKRNATTKV